MPQIREFAKDATVVLGDGRPLFGRAALATVEVELTGIRVLGTRDFGTGTIAEVRCAAGPAVAIWRAGGDGLLTDYRLVTGSS